MRSSEKKKEGGGRVAHLTGDGGEVALVRFGESQGKTVQISKCFFCLFVNLTANSPIFIGSS